MHYSQEKPRFDTLQDGDLLRVKGQGLVDVELISETLRDWANDYGDSMPRALLCDLRDVAGYGPGAGLIVRDWLRRADRQGVRRIAFLGSSAVLRTATRLLAPRVGVEIRTFTDEVSAKGWLRKGGDLPANQPVRAEI